MHKSSRQTSMRTTRRQARAVLLFAFNPFPHDKIFDQTKLKAFADDKLKVTKMRISVFVRVENIAGEGETACTSNFSFFHDVFKRLLSQTHQKVPSCGNGLINLSACQMAIQFSDSVIFFFRQKETYKIHELNRHILQRALNPPPPFPLSQAWLLSILLYTCTSLLCKTYKRLPNI